MSEQVPIRWRWNGETMEPASDVWIAKANERYVVGAEYRLVEIREQSERSRRHFHAVVRDAWLTLPDELAAQFETADHLRKHCTIKAGFHEKRSIHCQSVQEARKVASFIRPLDSYAIVTTAENVVTVWTALSSAGLDHQTFQRLKDGCLEEISKLIGTDAATLSRQGENA
jgi:hypothetical protein